MSLTSMKIPALLLLLVFSLSGPEAHAFTLRKGVMLGSSLINLFLMTLISWKSVVEDPRPRNDPSGFHPNYNFSPDSHEMILALKLAEGLPITPPSQGIRKLPRSYYEKILQQAGEKTDSLPQDAFARELFFHLQKQEENLRERWGHPWFEGRAHASYRFVSSPTRAIPGGVAGSINPFLTLQEGQFSEEGHNGSVGAGGRGALADWFSYEVEPRALFASREAGTQDHASFYLRRGYLKGNIRNFELEVGKDTVQWGLGHEGTMLFSGNAESFYLFRWGNSLPVDLPWFFRTLGPTRLDAFVTFLDANRDFPHSLINGVKMTFQPHRRWEIGVGQMIQFGGEGSESWSPLNYFGDALTNDQRMNRNLTLESRWRIPRLEIEPYLELYWEDCCRAVYEILNPRDTLNLAGIYFPNLGLGGRVDFAAEWVRTNRITYRHGQYFSGLFYKGHGIGHPIGPDGLAVYGILRYFHSPTVLFRMVSAFEQRGRQDGLVPEDRYRIVFNLQHGIARHLRLQWASGYEQVVRFNFQPGVNQHNVMSGVAVEIF